MERKIVCGYGMVWCGMVWPDQSQGDYHGGSRGQSLEMIGIPSRYSTMVVGRKDGREGGWKIFVDFGVCERRARGKRAWEA
jgi:hypothetical protein